MASRQEHRSRAQKAIGKAMDLLPREDPETTHAADARHWLAVYRELVAFKEGLVERVESSVESMSAQPSRAIAHTDLVALREQLEHYRSRLDFWGARHWELQRIDLDLASRTLHHNGAVAVLTRREAELLDYLVRRPERYFPPEEILAGAWGDGELHVEQVRTYVGRVRSKLAGLNLPCRITNRAQVGYALTYD